MLDLDSYTLQLLIRIKLTTSWSSGQVTVTILKVLLTPIPVVPSYNLVRTATAKDRLCSTDNHSLLSVVDCGPPPLVMSGQVSVTTTTFQSNATYSCSEGFQFASGAQEMSITCQANMMWSSPTPVCEGS